MNVRKYAVRMAVVILIIGALDCLWVWFASNPLPGAVVIPATTPLWVVAFIVIPMLQDEKVRKSQK